ncbi:Uncharacterised protein [Klebsiella pneumoniae]|uniref:Uncharacterized protein n=1 Tax=Klebsiella pneumoniae TaxID=573 RepID=A0A2X3KK10_KLEPN|nr:Uncharacterised protein [Klebsiella pneumoniae]
MRRSGVAQFPAAERANAPAGMAFTCSGEKRTETCSMIFSLISLLYGCTVKICLTTLFCQSLTDVSLPGFNCIDPVEPHRLSFAALRRSSSLSTGLPAGFPPCLWIMRHPHAASVSRPACYGTGGFSAQARRRRRYFAPVPRPFKERPSSRFRGISLPSKDGRLRYSTVGLTRDRTR